MIFNLMKPVPTTESATMYSYNGTVLPKLPEWDKTAYPYAMITSNVIGTTLFITDKVGVHDSTINFTSVTKMSYSLKTVGDKWVLAYEPNYYEEYHFAFTNLIWSNYDILNTDGSAFNGATEPIPVYE